MILTKSEIAFLEGVAKNTEGETAEGLAKIIAKAKKQYQCEAEYMRKYVENNRENHRERNRAYWEAKKEGRRKVEELADANIETTVEQAQELAKNVMREVPFEVVGEKAIIPAATWKSLAFHYYSLPIVARELMVKIATEQW